MCVCVCVFVDVGVRRAKGTLTDNDRYWDRDVYMNACTCRYIQLLIDLVCVLSHSIPAQLFSHSYSPRSSNTHEREKERKRGKER